MKEGWMKNDQGWGMNDGGWYFQAAEGFLWLTDRQLNKQTNEQTDICECGVAFATEKRDWKEWHCTYLGLNPPYPPN